MGRRRTPVLTAVDDILVSSGLQQDRHSIKKLLWESASNVIFADGTVRRKRAPALAFDTGNAYPIRGLAQQQNSNGGRWLWAACGSAVFRWQFGAPELVHLGFDDYTQDQTATQRPTVYDLTPYGNWMLMNSGNPGRSAYIFKDPGVELFAYPNAPLGVTKFLKVLSFLMAVGYGTRGTQVGWSDANNIEDWIPTTENSAGSLAIDEFNTPIRAGARLGQSVSVYSEDQMKLVNFIGAPFYFGQGLLLDGIGAIGKAAVASDLKVNVGVGRAGCWWTDGNTTRYIDEGYLANYLQENVNWQQGAKIVVGRNDYTGTFEFHFPMLGSDDINEAWAWDPKTGGWSPVPFASMMDERRLFGYPIQGNENGYVYWGDWDADIDTPLALETKPLVMQTEASPHTTVRVDEVDLLLHEASGLEWRLGCCDEPNGDWEWTNWREASLGARVYEVDELPEQPFWKLALRSTPGITNWELDLQGFLLYGLTTGTKM